MSPRRRKEELAEEADLHAGRELAPEPECKAPHTAVAALPSATLS